MDDLSNAISQLQNMLSSEEGKKGLENMIGSFGVSSTESSPTPSTQTNLFSPDNMMKMRSIVDSFQNHDDPRSQLLLALKPYLSSSRGARLDTAIMLLSLGKIPGIMKSFRG